MHSMRKKYHDALTELQKTIMLFCFISRTVAILNRSDIIVQFKWSNFATLREELQQKDRCYFVPPKSLHVITVKRPLVSIIHFSLVFLWKMSYPLERVFYM